jgi:hypothetical protein
MSCSVRAEALATITAQLRYQYYEAVVWRTYIILNVNLRRRVGTVCLSYTETAQDSFYAAIVKLLEGDIDGCKRMYHKNNAV